MSRAALVAAAALAALACSEEAPPPPPAAAPRSEAELALERVRQEPGSAEAWFHLSEIYERARLHEKEVEALQRVITLQPDMGWAHLRLGTACNRLGRYEEAVRHFRDAEPLMGRQATLYNNLAWSYGKLGRTGDEIATLRRAIALRPSYASAHFNLGVALLRKGARAEAEKELGILQALDEGAAASLEKELRPVDGRGGRR